jgi:spore coat polysaccharide biosynthesis protein SpsF (cytidylyltransferase family)
MGMTIDKAIDRLEDLHFEQDNWEYGELTDDCLLNREALRLAIETMRKYQKIQEIYQKWNEVNDFAYNQAMKEIGEVIESE